MRAFRWPDSDSEPCPYCNGAGCLPCRGRGTVGPAFRGNRGLPPYVRGEAHLSRTEIFAILSETPEPTEENPE